MSYKSESETARPLLEKYCIGNGIDIGAGGMPICLRSICIDRDEGSARRAHVGTCPTHLVGDAAGLLWFKDGVLDHVASSHTLEDFVDTESILREWLRVLRVGGNLVLFLPDEQTYRAHCARTGQPYNLAHVHADFGLAFVREKLARIGGTEEVEAIWPFPGNAYSFALVVRKVQ
jgi:SAM-dependent methyltransferase